MSVPGVSTPNAAAAVGAIPAVTTFKPKAKYRVGEEGLPVIQFPQCATGTEDRVATADHHSHSFSPHGWADSAEDQDLRVWLTNRPFA